MRCTRAASRRLSALLVAVCLLCLSNALFAQIQTAVGVHDVKVRILSTQPNAVSVQVTFRTGNRPVIIPDCHESGTEYVHCTAQLRRGNDKPVSVRRHLAAVLGVESEEYWKPVAVARDGEMKFIYVIDLGLLDVHPQEKLLISFEVWPTAESMKDKKQATTFRSPLFKIPRRAQR